MVLWGLKPSQELVFQRSCRQLTVGEVDCIPWWTRDQADPEGSCSAAKKRGLSAKQKPSRLLRVRTCRASQLPHSQCGPLIAPLCPLTFKAH